jgi:hypothetical protein
MFILGTLKQWRTVKLDADGTRTIRLLLQSFDDTRRLELLAAIQHMQPAEPAPLEEGQAPAEVDSVERMRWYNALAVAFGTEAIKAWEGIGHAVGEDGKIEAVPCTPENVALLMADTSVAGMVMEAIHDINTRFVVEVTAAGNA